MKNLVIKVVPVEYGLNPDARDLTHSSNAQSQKAAVQRHVSEKVKQLLGDRSPFLVNIINVSYDDLLSYHLLISQFRDKKYPSPTRLSHVSLN